MSRAQQFLVFMPPMPPSNVGGQQGGQLTVSISYLSSEVSTHQAPSRDVLISARHKRVGVAPRRYNDGHRFRPAFTLVLNIELSNLLASRHCASLCLTLARLHMAF